MKRRSSPLSSPRQPILGIRSNFLGAPVDPGTWGRARVAVLPVPFEQTVSYGKGTSRGPSAILGASAYVEFYDEETGRDVMRDVGIATLPPFRTPKKGKAAVDAIAARAGQLLSTGKFLLTLGGEHTISQALVRAHIERHPDLSILQIDAHSDLRESYQGSPYSHASVMARVCEFVDPKRVVQVGIRAQRPSQAVEGGDEEVVVLEVAEDAQVEDQQSHEADPAPALGLSAPQVGTGSVIRRG